MREDVPSLCNDPVYIPEGIYCQDTGKRGICSPCMWIKAVEATLKSVTEIQMQLQMDIRNEGATYASKAVVLDDVVNIIELFQYYFRKANSPFDTNISTVTVNSTVEEGDTNRESITDRVELMKLQVDMSLNLLSELTLPIERKIIPWLYQVRYFSNELLERKVQSESEILEIEKDTLSKIITEGKSIVTDSKELHDKNEISLPGLEHKHENCQKTLYIERKQK